MATKLKNDRPVVFHFRPGNKDVMVLSPKKEKGGVTVIYDPKVSKYGVALCDEKDNFRRSKGIDIASGRLKKASERPNVKTMDKVKKAAVKLARTHVRLHVKYLLAKLEEQQKKINASRKELTRVLKANS
jgi:hypothetical protein